MVDRDRNVSSVGQLPLNVSRQPPPKPPRTYTAPVNTTTRTGINPAEGMRRSFSDRGHLSSQGPEPEVPLFNTAQDRAEPVAKFFKDAKETRFGWGQARVELLWWALLPFYCLNRCCFLVYNKRRAKTGKQQRLPNTDIFSHFIRLRPAVYVYFCAMWVVAFFLPVYVPWTENEPQEHRYVRWYPLAAFVSIALLRTCTTAGLEQMHRVEGYLKRKSRTKKPDAGQAAAGAGAGADTSGRHGGRPSLSHQGSSDFDEWSWSQGRAREDNEYLGSARLFDARLRWILEFAAANSGNIRIREGTDWARGEDDSRSPLRAFNWMFRSHHPARISTVTSFKWNLAITLVVLGFDAIVLNTYCDVHHPALDLPPLCDANDSSTWHGALAAPAMLPSLLASSTMAYWILLMLLNVVHRYDFYYHTVRIFTLIHSEVEDIPEDTLKLRGTQLERLGRGGGGAILEVDMASPPSSSNGAGAIRPSGRGGSRLQEHLQVEDGSGADPVISDSDQNSRSGRSGLGSGRSGLSSGQSSGSGRGSSGRGSSGSSGVGAAVQSSFQSASYDVSAGVGGGGGGGGRAGSASSGSGSGAAREQGGGWACCCMGSSLPETKQQNYLETPLLGKEFLTAAGSDSAGSGVRPGQHMFDREAYYKKKKVLC
jgi:uncharacterized membrane protein YgcG